MYANRAGGRRKTAAYEAWCQHAGFMLNGQQCAAIEGPVHLDCVFGAIRDTGRKIPTSADTDNHFKCIQDALQQAGVLPDDNRKWVPSISGSWADIGHTVVTLTPINNHPKGNKNVHL